MSSSRFRRRLILAISSLAVLVPAGMAVAACPPARPLPPCNPAAFTGSVGAHASGCAQTPPSCRSRRGPRGPRGLRGVKGKTGTTGKTGRTGSRGLVGLTGAEGRDGNTGTTGSTGAAGSQGSQGVAGSDGVQGVAGSDGAQGVAGPDGADGPQGLQGVQGVVGADGSDGVDGTVGGDGPAGPIGPDGADGPQGPAGPGGADGPTGATGATGAAGPANGLSEYAYIFNVSGQTVAIEADVPFDSNGVITPGITHASGSANVRFVTAGDYKVAFSVSGTEPSQMALFLNGALVDGTVYGSGAGTQQNNGQAIITIGAEDVLSLKNHSSAAAVGLQTLSGGTQQNSNASLLIEKLN